MKKLANVGMLTFSVLLIFALQAMGAQSIKIVSSVDEIEAPSMQCRQDASNATALKLEINGISETPIEVARQPFSKIDLAPAVKLNVGVTSI